MRKNLRVLYSLILLLLVLGLTSCSYFIPFANTQGSQGTYSGEFYSKEEFKKLPVYLSDTYKLTSIEKYNDIILETKAHIIKANIAVKNTISRQLTSDIKNGSGFVYKEDDFYYYAVTNHHVIDNDGRTSKYEIKTFEDNEYHDATLVVYNKDIDLAIVKFSKNNRSEIEMININKRLDYRFKSDELVFAIGNPLNLTNNVTFGKYQDIVMIQNVDFFVIKHSAEIYNGSSGGALVDIDGNLIGVNTWGLDDGSSSFAVPNFVLYTFLLDHDLV